MRTGTFTVILMTGLLLAVTGLSSSVVDLTPDIVNPSFETLPPGGLNMDCSPGCTFSNGAIPGWESTPNGSAFSGQLQPGPAEFSFVPDGITAAYSNGGVISQTVAGVTVVPDVIYELMVDLGLNGTALPPGFAASADLLVGGHTIMATGAPPTSGSWSTFTASFTATPAEAGDSITIQLNSSGIQGNFDDVRLTATPEPGAGGLVGLGLAGLLAFVTVKRVRRA